eukprot:scaffold249937_cov34-Prasinocladus_malaysianus.AAC.1
MAMPEHAMSAVAIATACLIGMKGSTRMHRLGTVYMLTSIYLFETHTVNSSRGIDVTIRNLPCFVFMAAWLKRETYLSCEAESVQAQAEPSINATVCHDVQDGIWNSMVCWKCKQPCSMQVRATGIIVAATRQTRAASQSTEIVS